MLMVRQREPYFTPAEYLAIERAAETKSEYLDGVIVAKTGASRAHNLISTNLTMSLGPQLRAGPCELYAADMRVKVAPPRVYTYPDLVVVCGKPEFEDDWVDTLLNPTLVLEILSPSTESYDRGRKFRNYQKVQSLREYALVAQDEYRVERFSRQGDGEWRYANAEGLDAIIEFPAIDCRLTLRDIYDRVELG
jgi:Uma2 family endonuclease